MKYMPYFRRGNKRGFGGGLLILICIALTGCKSSGRDHSAVFVDRDSAFAIDGEPDPLRLVVEIDAEGKLRLNKIETGTMSDISDLSERIKVIFDDREKGGMHEREILIDTKIRIESQDFENLVRTLADLKASPIRVIKNDPKKQ
jgi:hypothetical protein